MEEFPEERWHHQYRRNDEERQRVVVIANVTVYDCDVGAYAHGCVIGEVELAGCALLLCRRQQFFYNEQLRVLVYKYLGMWGYGYSSTVSRSGSAVVTTLVS